MSATRRAVLGAIALAPAAALPAAATTARASGWAKILAAYRKAEADRKSFERDIYKPALRAYDRDVAAIPHHTMAYDAMGGRCILSTRDAADVKFARSFSAPLDDGRSPDSASVRKGLRLNESWRDDMLTFVAQADLRDAKRHAFHERHGLDAIDAQSGVLCDTECEALEAAILHPVTTIAELNEKMAIINETEGFELGFTAQAITADIARLAAAGRA
ncbi:hypothetical protein [Sphingomonas sanxanigenens]|uniref:Uncharacterized protein n=1 Tax=Sphingomonas sanxanigenens DSM 19645 = NX02 TaxID=1123269 RepID=W0ACB3_9SPHN|nr:hypothetical protein [Sphingomonas sanxanigenens]AHE55519.1 hypothetical protein NX02_19275 [Sphingomonas sanxanigenens DSM 19645 = NX02]